MPPVTRSRRSVASAGPSTSSSTTASTGQRPQGSSDNGTGLQSARQKAIAAGLDVPAAPRRPLTVALRLVMEQSSVDSAAAAARLFLSALAGAMPFVLSHDTKASRTLIGITINMFIGVIAISVVNEAAKAFAGRLKLPVDPRRKFPPLRHPDLQDLLGDHSTVEGLAAGALELVDSQRVLTPHLNLDDGARAHLENAGLPPRFAEVAEANLKAALANHLETYFHEVAAVELPPTLAQSKDPLMVRARRDLGQIKADGSWTRKGLKAVSTKMPAPDLRLIRAMEAEHAKAIQSRPRLFSTPETPGRVVQAEASTSSAVSAAPASRGREGGPKSERYRPFTGPSRAPSVMVGKIKEMHAGFQQLLITVLRNEERSETSTPATIAKALGKTQASAERMADILFDKELLNKESKGPDGSVSYVTAGYEVRNAIREVQLES